MPNIATLLKDEISRLSRREIRQTIEPLKKASATYRHEIAALKRQVAALERVAGKLSKHVAPKVADEQPTGARAPRFVAKGLRPLRDRLGVSVAEFAALMNVSPQSIYNWEKGSSSPQRAQVATLATLRPLGKKEARALLDKM
jgi:DNA-binding transcriptional regulator YiaG